MSFWSLDFHWSSSDRILWNSESIGPSTGREARPVSQNSTELSVEAWFEHERWNDSIAGLRFCGGLNQKVVWRSPTILGYLHIYLRFKHHKKQDSWSNLRAQGTTFALRPFRPKALPRSRLVPKLDTKLQPSGSRLFKPSLGTLESLLAGEIRAERFVNASIPGSRLCGR